MNKKSLEVKIKKLGLGIHEETVAIAAISEGKASKTFTKGDKESKFFCRLNKVSEHLTIHKIILFCGKEELNKNYSFNLNN